MNRTYRGSPSRVGRGGFLVTRQDGNESELPLNPRNDLWEHSPDGFAWGYGGSGPAQLALALAADVLGHDGRAVRVHQPLKWTFVALLDGNAPWVLDSNTLLGMIRDLEAAARHTAEAQSSATPARWRGVQVAAGLWSSRPASGAVGRSGTNPISFLRVLCMANLSRFD